MTPPTSRQEIGPGTAAERGTLDVALDSAKLVGGATKSVLVGAIVFGVFGAAAGLLVVGILFWTGMLAHPWEPWSYLRWLLLLGYPVAGAVALGWAGVWRGIGKVVTEVGVERGLVAYATEGLLAQLAQIVPERPAGQDPDPSEWKAFLRRALRNYSRSDDLTGTSHGFPRRLLGRIMKLVARVVVRILLGHTELLVLLGGALDGSLETPELVEGLEEYFAETVEDFARGPMIVAVLALAGAYVLVPIALAVSR